MVIGMICAQEGREHAKRSKLNIFRAVVRKKVRQIFFATFAPQKLRNNTMLV